MRDKRTLRLRWAGGVSRDFREGAKAAERRAAPVYQEWQ